MMSGHEIDCDEALACIERAQEWIIKMRRNPAVDHENRMKLIMADADCETASKRMRDVAQSVFEASRME